MQFSHGGNSYSLDHQWWTEAGMEGFVPVGTSYRAESSTFPDLNVAEVPIAEIEPLTRQLSGSSTSCRAFAQAQQCHRSNLLSWRRRKGVDIGCFMERIGSIAQLQ